MLHSEFTPEQVETLYHERFHHPHPRVQLKMKAVDLKSQGLPHPEIGRLVRISENTPRTSLRQFQEGGIERLKRIDWTGTEGERDEHHRAREDSFREHPPRSPGEAAAALEQIAGIRRGLTQVRKFLKGMGLKFRTRGMIPAQADADEPAKSLDQELWPRLPHRRLIRFGNSKKMPRRSAERRLDPRDRARVCFGRFYDQRGGRL